MKANQYLVLVGIGLVGLKPDGWVGLLQKFAWESPYPLQYQARAGEEGSEGPEEVEQAGFS